METETIKLNDGRSLAYAQYGDGQGRPVFFFHGSPGSRLFHPDGGITLKQGIRLITLDRPGYGGSSFQPGRHITDWPNDIARLADHLGLDHFSVAGHSGGCPYVLACAHILSDRVRHATLISGPAPVNSIKADPAMTWVNRFGLAAGRYIPWPLWQVMVNQIYGLRSKDPAQDMINKTRDRPVPDEAILSTSTNRELCIESEVEAYRQGLKGFAWDLRLLTRPWGFPLEAIHTPVSLWHGLEDNQAPVSMANYLAGVLPVSTLHLVPGEAHLLLLKYWQEITSDIVSHSA